MKRKKAWSWSAKARVMCALMLAVVAGSVTARADDAFDYIPDGVDLIGVMDVETLLSLEEMALLREIIEKDMGSEAAALKELNISLDNLKRIVFGLIVPDQKDTPDMAIVFDMKEDIDIQKFAAFVVMEDELERKILGEHTAYVIPDVGADFVILSPRRILFTTGHVTESAVTRATPITGNARMMGAANIPARQETLWMALLPTEDMLAKTREDGMPPFLMDLDAFRLTFSLGAESRLEVAGIFTNEESAGATTGLMQMLIPMVMMHAGELGIDQVPEVSLEDRAAKMAITLPLESLAEALSVPLIRARDNARVRDDTNRLQQIGGAYFIHLKEKGKQPGTVQDLVEAGYIDEDVLVSIRLKDKVPPPHFVLAPYDRVPGESHAILAWSLPHESMAGGVVLFSDYSVEWVDCPATEYAEFVKNLMNRSNPEEVKRILPRASTQGFE